MAFDVRACLGQQRLQDSSGRNRWVIGMPLKTALSRTCDRPTNARFPAKSSPRVKPGTSAIGWYWKVFGSMNPNDPAPDSQTHSRPAYQRGE
jgi:hypothetical protein